MRDQILDGIDFLAGDNLNRSQRESSGDLSGYSIHMADMGTDNFDREFALSLASTERGVLFEIEEAIRRLENGEYGACDHCGVKIPVARLKALPYARYCVPCQEEAEKRVRLGLPPFRDGEEDGEDGGFSFADAADLDVEDLAGTVSESESSGDEDS
jgi:RNA polymerase-binding protein DksA